MRTGVRAEAPNREVAASLASLRSWPQALSPAETIRQRLKPCVGLTKRTTENWRGDSGDTTVAIVVDMGTGADRSLAEAHEDRGFNEVDLRRMLEYAPGHHPDLTEGRFVVEARHAAQPWEVIVEPDHERQLLVVVTAYPVEQGDS